MWIFKCIILIMVVLSTVTIKQRSRHATISRRGDWAEHGGPSYAKGILQFQCTHDLLELNSSSESSQRIHLD